MDLNYIDKKIAIDKLSHPSHAITKQAYALILIVGCENWLFILDKIKFFFNKKNKMWRCLLKFFR